MTKVIDFELPQIFEYAMWDKDNTTGSTVYKTGKVSLMFKDILSIGEFLYYEHFPDDIGPLCNLVTTTGVYTCKIDYMKMHSLWVKYKGSLKGRLNTFYTN